MILSKALGLARPLRQNNRTVASDLHVGRSAGLRRPLELAHRSFTHRLHADVNSRLLFVVLGGIMLASCPQHLYGEDAAADEFQSLFDGTTLAGWRSYKQESPGASWSVEDGHIKGSGEAPDLMTVAQFGDFELQFEWKLAAGGNSGVIYRASEEGEQAFHSGLEYQVLDDEHFKLEELSPVHSAGAIYALYGQEEKNLNAAGEYNTGKVIARGNHIEHWLNDELVAECEIDSESWKTKIAASKFHEWLSSPNSPRATLSFNRTVVRYGTAGSASSR